MSNDRVAAAWRCISRATAATQPPAWIYERKASIGFCARFQQAKTDETRLLCLYNGYGTLLGFDRVQETVAAIISHTFPLKQGQNVFQEMISGHTNTMKVLLEI